MKTPMKISGWILLLTLTAAFSGSFASAAWPAYRHDNQRTAFTEEQLKLPLVRLRARTFREVRVLLRYTLSDLYPTVPASVARRGGKQRKENDQSAG